MPSPRNRLVLLEGTRCDFESASTRVVDEKFTRLRMERGFQAGVTYVTAEIRDIVGQRWHRATRRKDDNTKKNTDISAP